MEMNKISGENSPNFNAKVEVKMECPKRVLHFSDGTLEEFDNSDDNLECEQKQANMEVAEVRQLP